MSSNELNSAIAPIVERAQNLINSYAQGKLLSKPIIAIAGGSGAGKSYFSEHLQAALQSRGYRVLVINQDGFSPYNEKNPDALINVSAEKVDVFMQAIITGELKIEVPSRIRNEHPYSSTTPSPYTITHQTVNMADVDLIIFEGSLVLSSQAPYNFFHYCNMGIFIAATTQHMCDWKTEREMAKPRELQRPKEIFDEHVQKAIRVYYDYVLPTKRNATFIVYKGNKDQYVVIEQ